MFIPLVALFPLLLPWWSVTASGSSFFGCVPTLPLPTRKPTSIAKNIVRLISFGCRQIRTWIGWWRLISVVRSADRPRAAFRSRSLTSPTRPRVEAGLVG
jgi:hypothetical protein